MRFVLLAFILVLLAGCVSETAGIPENMSEVHEENKTDIPEEIIEDEIEEMNETVEPAVEINESRPVENINETATEIINETINEREEIEGLSFGGGRYLLILDDVAWYGDKSCAIVTIAYSDGTAIKKNVMCPRTDYYWTDSGGARFRFKVIDVAAGYSGEAWADIIIYG